MHAAPLALRRPARPVAPRCRGGASSLLRVSATTVRRSDGVLERWLRESQRPTGHDDPQPGFITPLQPSVAVTVPTPR